MVLDIKLLRDTDGLKLVRESEKRRYNDPALVDEIVAYDDAWRDVIGKVSKARARLNAISKQIGQLKKKKENADELIAQVPAIKEEMAKLEAVANEKKALVDKLLPRLGNIVHQSVPVSDNEDNNEVVRTFGDAKTPEVKELRFHHELLHMIDGYEPERGVKVAGHRGYFLKGVGLKLNRALISYGLDFLEDRKYTQLQPPLFMSKDVMACTAQLEDFDEELYGVTASGDTETGKYLIATSEQPISALHKDEWLTPSDLPLKYAGISYCFRKESGKHGKDTWGLYRVHQFEKVEQFLVTAPEKSWEAHEEMIKVSEDFFQSLGISYRIVNLVSKELNNAAAKKYDLEGWFPCYKEYKELVSCSNCTDYQARSLEVRYGTKKKGEKTKVYAHMLNSTLCATTRTLCAVLENYQTDDGIVVPEVLRPYMRNLEFIPFVKEPFKKRPTIG